MFAQLLDSIVVNLNEADERDDTVDEIFMTKLTDTAVIELREVPPTDGDRSYKENMLRAVRYKVVALTIGLQEDFDRTWPDVKNFVRDLTVSGVGGDMA
jgi:hypothetical protein